MRFQIAERLSTRTTGQAISTLESQTPVDARANTYRMDFEPELQRQLMKAMQVPMQPTLMVTGAQIHGIVDAVRNTILDWSLRLEKAGIVGKDMTFSKEEKARATDAGVTNYHVQNQTVIHGMEQSQVQQGTFDSTQIFAQAPLDLEAVAQFIGNLRTNLDALDLSSETRAEVEADLNTVEAQAKLAKPRLPIVKEALRSLRSILENAVGGAGGAALPAILEQLKTFLQ